MAKIDFKKQNIFCGASGASGILGVFGSKKNNLIRYSTDVEDQQSLSIYRAGLGASLINGSPPAVQDLNALCFLITRHIAYLQQRGIAQWNSSTTYYQNNYVSRSVNYVNGESPSAYFEIFKSLVNDNLNNALSDTSKWILCKSNRVRYYSGTTASLAWDDSIVHMDSSSNMTFTIPYPTSNYTNRIFTLINKGTGEITVQTALSGGSGANIDKNTTYTIDYKYAPPNGSVSSFFCYDGAWYSFSRFNQSNL